MGGQGFLSKELMMLKKCLFLFVALTLQGTDFVHAENNNHKLPPLDGVRHGATREVFEKMVKAYQEKPYQVSVDANGKKEDYTGGRCMELMNALRSGKATYVAPKFITDDYNDKRLSPYREKYKNVVASKSADSEDAGSEEEIPGEDWFGGVIEARSWAFQHATRNFAIYELDLDKDGENEVIFYGEFWVHDLGEEPGDENNYSPLGAPSFYIIYKQLYDADSIGTFGEYDFNKQKHLINYTAIFRYEENYYVISSAFNSAYKRTEIKKLSSRILDGRSYYSNSACGFSQL